MTAGYQIIRALGKRGLRGFYFSYAQYKELSGIQTFDEAREKIVEWGFKEVQHAKDIESLVDRLQSFQSELRQNKGCLGFMMAEPIFWVLLAFTGCIG